jgi:hypothetical protein
MNEELTIIPPKLPNDTRLGIQSHHERQRTKRNAHCDCDPIRIEQPGTRIEIWRDTGRWGDYSCSFAHHLLWKSEDKSSLFIISRGLQSPAVCKHFQVNKTVDVANVSCTELKKSDYEVSLDRMHTSR